MLRRKYIVMDIRNKIINQVLSFAVVEEVLEACYFTDDLRDFFQKELLGRCPYMCCGSFAEGMTNFNDTDGMSVLEDFLVVEHSDNIPETYRGTVLLLKPDQCEPGYTRLELYRNTPGNQLEIYSNQDEKLYLDRTKLFKIKVAEFDELEKFNVVTHGPALLVWTQKEKRNSDLVMCFHCPVWPTLARREFHLCKNNNQNFKAENIRRDGCHIVPIAHPNSKHPNIEFRISFSAAEKYIMQNWSKNQMDLYFLCKELINKFFWTGQDLEKGLCSYFAKTIILWMNERYSEEFWKENSTLSILGQFIDELRKNIADKSCPNYFVPNNLMMGTYTDLQVNSLLSKLDDVATDMFYSIICCKSFSSFVDQRAFVSLYKTIIFAGDQSRVTEILTSIYQEQYLCLDRFKKCIRFSYIHSYFLEFTSFLGGSFFFSLDTHPFQEFLISSVAKRLNETFQDSYLLQYAHMHINRCLAMSVFLPALFHLKEKETELKNKLWRDTEKLFILSMDVPGELSDGGFNGSVHLGLFYYLTNHRDKSMKILVETRCELLKLVPMLLITEPTRFLKTPRYLENENILRDLFEKWHLHGGCRIDPSFLRLYLMNRITNGKLDLTDSLKTDHKICYSEASNYIRYRLGLFPKGSDEFTKYSKEKVCVYRCSLLAKFNKSKSILYHPRDGFILLGFYMFKKKMTFICPMNE